MEKRAVVKDGQISQKRDVPRDVLKHHSPITDPKALLAFAQSDKRLKIVSSGGEAFKA